MNDSQPSRSNLIFVFDVEAIGLYGDVFALGYVVQKLSGEELESGFIGFPSQFAKGSIEDRAWVEKNVLPHLPKPTITEVDMKMFKQSNPALKLESDELYYHYMLRSQFWATWKRWKQEGAQLWADCAYPLESTFIRDCVLDNIASKTNDFRFNPYPIHEVATALLLAGKDPVATYNRLETENPAYHPTFDSRQSARLIRESIEFLLIQSRGY